VTLAGRHGAKPPDDRDGFLACAQQLRTPTEDLEQRLAFSEALNHLAAEDPAVHKLLFEVLHLLKPRSALGDPDLVERVKALTAAA